MAQSYNVSALPNYVDQMRPELIAKSVIGAKSADLFNLLTGVKGPTALNLISSEVVFGDGSTCGWTESGATSLSQAVLTPRALKINMSICDKTLLAKWASYLVKVEANKLDSDLPFEEYFINDVIKGVKAGIEKMIYQGDSESDSAIEFDGLIKILTASGNTTIVTTGASSVTSYNFIKQVASQMPASILDKDDLVILVSMPMYMDFIQNLVAANLYHYNPGNGDNEYLLPGTNIKVIGVNGLNNTPDYDYVIAGSLSNMFYGCNLEDGDEVFDLWYSKDNREFRFAIEFVAGVQVAYQSEIVLGKRSKN
jgi:hypothetical protein